MTDGPPEPTETALGEAGRRRRRAAVFGDVLPEATSDDRDPDHAAAGEADSADSADERLRREVPPHHG